MTYKALRIAMALLAVLLAVKVIPNAQGSSEVALRAAMETETVKGDLRAAIEQYKVVAAGTDRAIAARALLRMAECYQKLGDAEAQNVYQQLVREYADQPEAVAIARARLPAPDRAAPGGAVALRKVWSDDNVEDIAFVGSISPDGRYLSYAGRFNTAVMLRDLVTGTSRVLNAGDWGTLRSAISKDGSQVAYDKFEAFGELWVSPLGSGSLSPREAFERLPIPTAWPSPLGSGSLPPARSLFAGADVARIEPHDWSPDGRRIAVSVTRKDQTVQIGWVAVADGSLRVLKSVDWRGPTRLYFSPDGSDIAFDLPANDSTDDRDVFVLAADGGRETRVAVSQGNDVVIGWSPDGRSLLFASDRSGAMGLWAVPFADHTLQGAPIVVKADIGNVLPLGVTRSGALYWSAAAWNQDIEIVPVDLGTGTQTGPPVKPIQRYTGTNTQPAWSPDGKWLAYRSARGSSLATGAGNGPSVIGIRSSEAGDIRELRPALSYFFGLTWAHDGRSLVVFGTDLKGQRGVFRIDARTGDVTPIIMPISPADQFDYGVFSWSPDGSRLYYHLGNGSVHERDLSSGTERVIVSGQAPAVGFAPPQEGTLGRISLSPDGRLIASSTSEGSSSIVVLIPVDGGERRTLFRVNEPSGIGDWILWTPDGRGMLVEKLNNMTSVVDVTSELWLVPVDGTTPRRLDIDLNRVVRGGQGRMQLSPDGRQLTFVSGRYPIMEVWALENFLPAATATQAP